MQTPNQNRLCLPLPRCVDTLLVSGLYGMVAGAALGGVVGCIIGTIEPVVGNLLGLFLGGLAGGLAGLPTGVVGAGLEERDGWRLGGGFSLLTVGLCFLWACHSPPVPAWVALLFAACVQVGFWGGGQAHDRIERGTGFYHRWKMSLRCGLHRLSLPERSYSLLVTLTTVTVLYATLFHFLRTTLSAL